MADEEIRYRIIADTADAVRNVDDVADAERRMNTETERGRKGAGDLSEVFRGLQSELRNLVLGAASIHAVTEAFRMQTEELRKNAEMANRVKEAQLDLMFLSQDLNLEELAMVNRAAGVVGGEDAQVEVAGAFAQFKSQTAHLSSTQRNAYFQQLIESSLTTSAAPSSLVELYSRGSLYVSDPNRLQNIIRQTQILSPEASPQALAQLLPRVLPLAGQDTGLAPEQIAGLLVTAMSQSGSPEMGATGLRNILTIISGGVQGEGANILAATGANQGNALQRLEALAAANLSIEQRTQLFGRENVTLATSMMGNLGLARSNINQIVGATSGGADLTAEAIANMYGGDAQTRTMLQQRQAEAELAAARAADADAQFSQMIRQRYEADLVRQGVSPIGRKARLIWFDLHAAHGNVTPERVANDPALRGYLDGPVTDVTIINQQINNGDEPAARKDGRNQQ